MKRKGMVTKSFDHSDDVSAPHQTLATKTQSNKSELQELEVKAKRRGHCIFMPQYSWQQQEEEEEQHQESC